MHLQVEFCMYAELSVHVRQRDVSLPVFGVFPITAHSLLVILLKWMGGYIKNTTSPSVKNS